MGLYPESELCLQMSRFILNITVINWAMTRVQNVEGNDLGNTAATDGSKTIRTERQNTRALARTIGLAQLDTPAFVYREFVLC